MKSQQLEEWARHVTELVLSGAPVEDDRIELKSEWIDAAQAARRLAAHANTARGEPILWIIGLDEKDRAVRGVAPVEMANWLAGVAKHFDGEPPVLVRHANIHYAQTTIVALYFRTDVGAPFVIKNPAGGYPDFEVPWRKGTRLRAASRTDLLSVLVPVATSPTVSLLSVKLSLSVIQNSSNPFGVEKRDSFDWKIETAIYVTPRSRDVVVIPHLNCVATFSVSDYGSYELPAEFKPLGQSSTVICATTEAVFHGPGSVRLLARGAIMEDFRSMSYRLPQGFAEVTIVMVPTNGMRPIRLVRHLKPIIDSSFLGKLLTGNQRNWVLEQ